MQIWKFGRVSARLLCSKTPLLMLSWSMMLFGQGFRVDPTRIQGEVHSFRSCVAQKGHGPLDPADKRKLILECRKQYPTGSKALACKADSQKLKQPKKARQFFETCMKDRFEFPLQIQNPDKSKPDAKTLSYLGVPLDREYRPSHVEYQKFSCDHLQQSLHDINKARFLMFGQVVNLPRRIEKEFQNWRGFGRIYAPDVFFPPLGVCVYTSRSEDDEDDKYQSHEIFHLIDRQKKRVFPYFVISFSEDKKILENANRFFESLGLRKVYTNKLRDFYAASVFTEFDSEKDPQNVCKNNAHERIGLVSERFFGIVLLREYCEFVKRVL